MSRVRTIILVIVCMCSFFLLTCGNGADTGETEYKELTVLTPENGDTVRVGDTVLVSWAYPPDWMYSQVLIQLYGSKGLVSFGDITPGGINKPQDTVLWIVKASQKSNDCYIMVREYNGNDYAVTDGFFTITD